MTCPSSPPPPSVSCASATVAQGQWQPSATWNLPTAPADEEELVDAPFEQEETVDRAEVARLRAKVSELEREKAALKQDNDSLRHQITNIEEEHAVSLFDAKLDIMQLLI
jgi:predicted RNase H-like nuclease (RuvC/YqgF family)